MERTRRTNRKKQKEQNVTEAKSSNSRTEEKKKNAKSSTPKQTVTTNKKRGRPLKPTNEANPRRKQIKRQQVEAVIKGRGQNEEKSPSNSVELKLENAQNDEKTSFTCKYCEKDFSSSFILCLHLRIHEKVENADKLVAEVKEEKLEEEEGISCEPFSQNETRPGLNINKNFVENLKKNLSLAMSKKV